MSCGRSTSPFKIRLMINKGTSRETKLAINVISMMFNAETFPETHSMMVVTSPIGDHAPPELAARITIPAKNQRSFLSPISLRSRATITIEVVMLSRMADMKKARIQMTHSNFTFFVVAILSVMILNPPCVSISSTMVIAPSRKKMISAVSPRACTSCPCISQSMKLLPGLLI